MYLCIYLSICSICSLIYPLCPKGLRLVWIKFPMNPLERGRLGGNQTSHNLHTDHLTRVSTHGFQLETLHHIGHRNGAVSLMHHLLSLGHWMESAIHQDTRVHDFTKNTQDYTRLYYRLHNYIVIILFDSNASCWAETKNSWDSRCPDTLNQYLTNIFITVWFHPMPKKDMEENMLRRSCSTVRDWY